MKERDLEEYQMSDDSETEWEIDSDVGDKPWWEPTEDDYESWGHWFWWSPEQKESMRVFWDPWRNEKSTKRRGYPMDDEEKALEIDGWLEWKEWSDTEKRKWGEKWLTQQGMEITEESKKLVCPYWKNKKERTWEDVVRRSY